VKFNELIRLIEQNGFELIREKGYIRYYAKPGEAKLIRSDYHGSLIIMAHGKYLPEPAKLFLKQLV
jgi:hypothetical protein